MKKLRLLIVEDAEEDLDSCRDALVDYKHDKKRDIELVECKTLDEALKELDNSFDGVIVDLKLTPLGDEGNRIIEEIRKSLFRIPIFIFTGNPGIWNESIKGVEVFIKGEIEYYDLLNAFCETYDIGFTRILGGGGKIEELLGKVFLENLLKRRKEWVSYGKKDLKRTENALLRHTLNHLLQLLEEDDEKYFPEEVYLHPPMSEQFMTGSIVEADNQWFVVLSPACDLVIDKDNDECSTYSILDARTEYILLVEIESIDDALEGKNNKGARERLANNSRQYRHWLPPTNFFDGGVINFRKLKSLHKEDFKEQFEKPCIQISPPFVKDIVSRFSTYYARQGQPDLDSEAFVNNYTPQQNEGQ